MAKKRIWFGNGAKTDREQKLKKTKTKEASDRLPVAPPSYDVQELKIADIVVPEGRRALNPETLKELKKSVSLLGLQTPITVRPVKIWGKDKWYLVIGLHRLEVMKQLGKTTIPCFILEDDERAARMCEISENLHHADLTPAEYDEQLAEWVRLYEEGQPIGQNVQDKGRDRRKVSISEAARRLPVKGKNPAAKRKRVERALKSTKVSPEAKEEAKKVGVYNSSNLRKIAAEKPEAQLAKVRELAARRTKKGTVKKPLSAAEEKVLADLLKKWNEADELKGAFTKASPNVRKQFTAKILKDQSH